MVSLESHNLLRVMRMDVQYRLLTKSLDIRKSGSILFMSLNMDSNTWNNDTAVGLLLKSRVVPSAFFNKV